MEPDPERRRNPGPSARLGIPEDGLPRVFDPFLHQRAASPGIGRGVTLEERPQERISDRPSDAGRAASTLWGYESGGNLLIRRCQPPERTE
jgi:hypothetical protein